MNEGLPTMKRGAMKAFREYLNRECTNTDSYRHNAGGRHIYQQRTRLYGDYLYAQDREMFNFELHETIYCGAHKTFDWKRWVSSPRDVQAILEGSRRNES